MLLIERYLLRQFALTFAAVVVVLAMVGLGGLMVDLMAEISRGKVPAALLLSQLALRSIQVLPLLLPLALFVGLLMAVGRLYGESEMAVLASVGVGPRQMWKPLALIVVPVAAVVAAASLWLAPLGAALARDMIETANRSFLIAGLDAGRFMELPGRAGVIYVGGIDTDGTKFERMFVQTERDGRLDVITAASGEMFFEGDTGRFLRLRDGFRVEGDPAAMDYRLMRFETNEVQVPDREARSDDDDLAARTTLQLLRLDEPAARGELHWRLATPLLTLLLGVMALSLGRGEARQARYGRVFTAVLVYLVSMMALLGGKAWLASGALPGWLGLWWLLLPMALLAAWLYATDGRMPAPRRGRA